MAMSGVAAGAYALEDDARRKKKSRPADEQFDYYSSVPPAREATATPVSVSTAGVGAGMAGIGVIRAASQGVPPRRESYRAELNDPYGGLADEGSGANEGGWGVANQMHTNANAHGGGPQHT